MLAGLFGRRDRAAGEPARLKSASDLECVRRAARVARRALREAEGACREGVTTAEIERLVRRHLELARAQPLFLGYRQGKSPPFPAAMCISVNEEVVHGIPGERALEAGDVVTLDVGVRLDGWCADTASTFVVRGASGGGARERSGAGLIVATRGLLDLAARLVRPGVKWSSIAKELERAAFATGYGIITEYVGHGIGRELHEPPRAPAYWSGFDGPDFVLEPGMVLAVEPMLCAGRGLRPTAVGGLPGWRVPVMMMNDGWTVVTSDGSASAHEEHMMAVTASGVEILTEAKA